MSFFYILKQAAIRFYDRDGSLLAAGLAYYTPFALTPLIVVSIMVLSMVYGSSFVISMLLHWGGVLGPDLLKLLEDSTRNLRLSTETLALPLAGTIFFSSAVIVAFNSLTSGFNYLWDIPHQGWRGWLNKTWHSVIFIFILQSYLILIMGLDGLFLTSAYTVIPYAQSIVTIMTTTVLFYLMYRFLSHVVLTRMGSLIGAITAAALLEIAKTGVTYYISLTTIPRFSDTAGLIIVLLIWIYVAAAIIYYGAAVVHEYDAKHSGRPQ